jgi:hypothetical protein
MKRRMATALVLLCVAAIALPGLSAASKEAGPELRVTYYYLPG